MNQPASKSPENQPLTDPREARKAKMKAVVDAGGNPYVYVYDRDAKAGDLQTKYADLAPGVETEDVVSVAGRIMA
ncbi:MAG TPA: lysine--tRNA ligase, partial [Alphaproteobacteria bacterium]